MKDKKTVPNDKDDNTPPFYQDTCPHSYPPPQVHMYPTLDSVKNHAHQMVGEEKHPGLRRALQGKQCCNHTKQHPHANLAYGPDLFQWECTGMKKGFLDLPRQTISPRPPPHPQWKEEVQATIWRKQDLYTIKQMMTAKKK